MKIRFLFIYYIFIVVFSCKPENDEVYLLEYPFNEDFKGYLRSTFELEVNEIENQTLVMIPFESCTPCVDSTLKELIAIKAKNISIFFIGQPVRRNHLESMNIITNTYSCYLDSLSQIFKYESNIGSPTVLYRIEGQIEGFYQLSAQNWVEAKKVFNQISHDQLYKKKETKN
ncbi:MAG: hypothetical protein IPH42_03055 [Bacteroidetes bacterium]|nr:hypothetical protein [Bacteroidota bacterium]